MTEPRPREVLGSIPAYRPGRAAEHERQKLSSNENPFPPLPGVIKRATEQLHRMNRYPDAGVTELTEAVADRTGIEPDQLAFGTGSVAVLFGLLDAWCGPGDEVVYPWRSFEAYPLAVDLPGATSVRVPLRPDHGLDLPAMAEAITDRTKVVIVCTPNNPTGPVVTEAEFKAFMAHVPGRVLVVVDEAYLEFVRDTDAMSGADALATYANVVVLRTFSKAYGLAGLRVGYAMGSPAVAGAIRKALPPFGVTDVAQAAALASLEADEELALRVETLAVERDRLIAALRKQGWTVPDSQANFVWLPLGEHGAAFADHVWPLSVRHFPEGVRVSIGSPEVNAAFLASAATFAPIQ